MPPASVSVVIPSYNAAAFLPQAVASALAQTRAAAEVIVVDDGSADGSPEVAAGCGARVIRQAVNGGPGAARNAGIRAARGELVALLDADDYWEPGHLETVAGLLDAHPAAAVASSRVRYLSPDARVSAANFAPGTPFDARVPLLRANVVVQTTAVVRRAAVLTAGGYDPALRFSEDCDLWMRVSRASLFVLSHDVTARYRVHAQQATRDRVRLTAGGWEVRRRHFAWLAAEADPATVAAGARAAQRALDDELRWAWNDGDRGSMAVMFGAEAWLPGAAPIVRRWRGRVGRAEPLWRTARSLVRAVGRIARR